RSRYLYHSYHSGNSKGFLCQKPVKTNYIFLLHHSITHPTAPSSHHKSCQWAQVGKHLALALLLFQILTASGPLTGCHLGPFTRAACSQNSNKTCEECLKNVSCLWCNTNKACLDYPVTKILPPGSLCKLSSARWGVCWVNFEALIITMSVLGGAVLLGVAVCCCCCCRRKKSRKPDKSEEKAMREREERRIRQEERRAEMKSRHDEIRKKYGLFKEENPYARFENN
uniref:PTTG1 interacting protein n=1 Tax=Equus asinus TaxID=9793 RepID=A0A9L0J7G7_EQUAS